MMNKLVLPILILFCQFCFGQNKPEQHETLNKYDSGTIMREHIKYPDNDTVVEKVYHENGQLNYLNQLVNGQRNGKSLVYLENGDLVFEQYYSQGKLNGESKSFYSNGTVQRIENFELGSHVDMSIYYNGSAVIIRKVIYKDPCVFVSSGCEITIIEFKNGTKVYSYSVIKGKKSGDHIVFDQDLYKELRQSESATPKLGKGKTLFKTKCSMCHGVDKPIVGPALDQAIKNKSEGQLYEIIVNSNTHPSSKISKEEFEALMEFLKAEKDE